MTITRRELLAGSAATLQGAPRRPNFLFIFSDDQHFQTLGAAGNPYIRTPNLDRLASRGVHFTNGIISTSQCCPSRGVVLSGLESYQSGLISNQAREFRPGLGPAVVDQMRHGGYDTVLVGKWHIQPLPGECGFSRAPLWFHGGSMRYQNPTLRRELGGKEETVRGHITDLLTESALEYLRAPRPPFFLWLCYNAPHSPLYAEERYRRYLEGKDPAAIAPPFHPTGGAPYDWRDYYAVITHLDEAVGRVIGQLERARLWGNTVVFFLGDNGWMGGTRNWQGKVVPYEESVRVPFLAAGAGVKRGLRLDAPVASVDVPATMMDLAGLRPAYRLAGRSMRTLLRSGAGGADAAFSAWDDGRPGALAGGRTVEAYRLVRTRRHKLIVWESGKQELYDVQEDPAERRDLSGDTRLAASLRELLRARMEETQDRARAWRW